MKHLFIWAHLSIFALLSSCGNQHYQETSEITAANPTTLWGTFKETVAGFPAFTMNFYAPSKAEFNFSPDQEALTSRKKLNDLIANHMISANVPFKVDVVIDTNGALLPSFLIKSPLKKRLQPIFQVASVQGEEYRADREKLFDAFIELGLNSYIGDKVYLEFDGVNTKAGLINNGNSTIYKPIKADFLQKLAAGQLSNSADPRIREAVATKLVNQYLVTP